jgi:Glycosyl hydrolases family 16
MRIGRVHPRWVAGSAVAGLVVAMVAVTAPLASSTSGAATNRVTKPTPCVGQLRFARNEPSRVLPLGPNAVHGYTRTYCADFSGTTLPPGWDTFQGQPKGDSDGMFERWHVRIRGGALRINTYRDPLLKWRWVTGGVCQCGRSRAYGAYFIRARITAAGASAIALLWPKNNSWPPEVDFLETWQQPTYSTSTLHFPIHGNPGDHKIQKRIKMNLTAWRTWGVTWTPTSMKFTVGTYTYWTITNRAEIPHLAMTLDLQQQSWCGIFVGGCPVHASSMLVDWVAEFVPNQYLHQHVTRATPTIPRLTP